MDLGHLYIFNVILCSVQQEEEFRWSPFKNAFTPGLHLINHEEFSSFIFEKAFLIYLTVKVGHLEGFPYILRDLEVSRSL